MLVSRLKLLDNPAVRAPAVVPLMLIQVPAGGVVTEHAAVQVRVWSPVLVTVITWGRGLGAPMMAFSVTAAGFKPMAGSARTFRVTGTVRGEFEVPAAPVMVTVPL